MERQEILGRGQQVGLVLAAAAVPGTFAASLSERTWMDQGLITGLSTGTHFLLSVIAQDAIDAGGAAMSTVLPFPESWTDKQREQAATLLLDLAVREGRPIGRFTYRAKSPLFLPDAFTVNLAAEGGLTRLWAASHDGGLAMEAEAGPA